METIKLNITIDKDWLEATWKENEKQLHCESFSGHPEHIAMLEAKALEFGTSLDEYAQLITQAKEAFVMPTSEELLAYELDQKIQEAKMYLAQTDWVKDYKLRHDLGIELIPEDSSKWVVIAKREEYIEFLRGAK
jgi:hypothetical protein